MPHVQWTFSWFFCYIELEECHFVVSASNLPAFSGSIFLVMHFPLLLYPGESIHHVRHLHLQDFVAKVQTWIQKNWFSETYCIQELCRFLRSSLTSFFCFPGNFPWRFEMFQMQLCLRLIQLFLSLWILHKFSYLWSNKYPFFDFCITNSRKLNSLGKENLVRYDPLLWESSSSN